MRKRREWAVRRPGIFVANSFRDKNKKHQKTVGMFEGYFQYVLAGPNTWKILVKPYIF